MKSYRPRRSSKKRGAFKLTPKKFDAHKKNEYEYLEKDMVDRQRFRICSGQVQKELDMDIEAGLRL